MVSAQSVPTNASMVKKQKLSLRTQASIPISQKTGTSANLSFGPRGSVALTKAKSNSSALRVTASKSGSGYFKSLKSKQTINKYDNLGSAQPAVKINAQQNY